MLNHNQIISYDPEQPPQLLVVIDTEEEFDWSVLPTMGSRSVQAIREIHRVQAIFDEYEITPCYVVDYPIASQQEGIDHLKPILNSGRCEIGAHLHPWVNPPYTEESTWSNTYPGNLGYDLELAKLECLSNQIQKSFGIKPEIYKAGRYGVGQRTTNILEHLGYTIDLSICSAFDYRADGGPDFSDFSASPYWFGENEGLLEIPLSGAFVGSAGPLAKYLYKLAGHFNFLKAKGILSKLGIVDRLMLSPEGYEPEEHKKLTRHLYNLGVRTFTWNFHSPSVVPGMTMYTQSNRDVTRFLDSCRWYFDYFLGEFKGVTTTPMRVKQQLETEK